MVFDVPMELMVVIVHMQMAIMVVMVEVPMATNGLVHIGSEYQWQQMVSGAIAIATSEVILVSGAQELGSIRDNHMVWILLYHLRCTQTQRMHIMLLLARRLARHWEKSWQMNINFIIISGRILVPLHLYLYLYTGICMFYKYTPVQYCVSRYINDSISILVNR